MYEPLDLTTDERSLLASRAAWELIFSVAKTSGGRLVLEANWRPAHCAKLLDLDRPLAQVFCDAPTETLRSRVRGRIATGERHPVQREQYVPGLLERVINELGQPRLPLD